MKKAFQALVVLMLLGIGMTAAAQDPAPYLALGDSVPFGYNPLIWTPPGPPVPPPNLLSYYHGYPQYVSGALNLALSNASCPGETSGSFLTGPPDNGCSEWRAGLSLLGQAPLFVTYSPSTETQARYAVSFLAAHPHTKLVTITIGGDDLLLLEDKCAAQSTNPAAIESCELAGLGDALVTFAKNLTAIYLAIRIEGRYQGPIVAVNYFSPDYDNAIATLSLLELNGITQGLTEAFGGKVADAFSAFGKASIASGGLPCAPAVGLAFPNPLGPGGCDVHPTAAGQQLIAKLVLQALK
jgi:hypothetical protein